MNGLVTERFATTDVEQVEAMLRGVGAPSWFQVPGADRDAFSFGSTVATDHDLTLVRYDVAGSWSLRAEPDLFLVAMASSDAMRWSKGEEVGDFTGGPVHFPPRRNDVRLEGPVKLFEVQFTPRALRRLAAQAHGVEYIRIGEGLRRPRSPQHGRYWVSVMQYAKGLFDSGLLRNAHLAAALKTNLAVSLMESFALSDGVRQWRLPTVTAQAEYRRAVDYIHATASHPVGGIDVSVAAGVPFSVLNDHFLTQCGLSIAGYLRKYRVIAAHEELARTAPDRAAAEAVVRRWGFSSLATYLPLHTDLYPERPLILED